MKQIDFYRALKSHCIAENADCTKCCMRLYCYTPPCERTDSMMEKVIEFLNIEHSHTESQDQKDRYICSHVPDCPCDIDMSTAIGYECR